MPASLKLISLNIERSKHLDLVIPFLEEQNPDVVCMQELCEADISQFRDFFGTNAPLYAANTRETEESGAAFVHGNAILSRLPVSDISIKYYAGDPSSLPESVASNSDTFAASNQQVIMCNVVKEGASFRIGTTHFTWSPGGQATDLQRTRMKKLLKILSHEKEFILSGDFNAPRGGEIFAMLAEKYKDNIPAKHATSLDLNLHRAGKTRPHELADKMVDGLFTTPHYRADNVELVFGVSDHAAVVATMYTVDGSA